MRLKEVKDGQLKMKRMKCDINTVNMLPVWRMLSCGETAHSAKTSSSSRWKGHSLWRNTSRCPSPQKSCIIQKPLVGPFAPHNWRKILGTSVDAPAHSRRNSFHLKSRKKNIFSFSLQTKGTRTNCCHVCQFSVQIKGQKIVVWSFFLARVGLFQRSMLQENTFTFRR